MVMPVLSGLALASRVKAAGMGPVYFSMLVGLVYLVRATTSMTTFLFPLSLIPVPFFKRSLLFQGIRPVRLERSHFSAPFSPNKSAPPYLLSSPPLNYPVSAILFCTIPMRI